MKPAVYAALCIIPIACATANAADINLELNPAQTHVTWTLGDVLHTVHGTFRLTRDADRGQVHVPVEDPDVDATSGESGSGARDGRMHKNVLESTKYPTITFKPDHVLGVTNLEGDSQIQVHGSFGIHGVEHELTVPARVHFSNNQMTATIDFLVPFVKWGMKDPSTLFLKVKDTVEIEVQTSAAQSQP